MLGWGGDSRPVFLGVCWGCQPPQTPEIYFGWGQSQQPQPECLPAKQRARIEQRLHGAADRFVSGQTLCAVSLGEYLASGDPAGPNVQRAPSPITSQPNQQPAASNQQGGQPSSQPISSKIFYAGNNSTIGIGHIPSRNVSPGCAQRSYKV